MPVFLVRRHPHYVSRPDFLNRITPALHPASAGRHDQNLTERMRVPCRMRTGFKCDVGGRGIRLALCLEQGIDAHGTNEVFAGRVPR